MPNVYYNRVIETSSNTPTNSGTVTVNLSGTSPTMTFIGSGTSAGRKFVDVVATGGKCLVHIFQTNSPSLWCATEVTFTDASPDTLTFVAGDVLDGSSGAGSLVTFTGTVTCELNVGARDIYHSYLSTRGYIKHGSWLVWTSATAIGWSNLELTIDGIIRTIASGSQTSATTLTNLSGSTVTLGSNQLYMAFATSAGNVRFEHHDGTGDGADPLWSSDLDYWYAASTGTSARLIGTFWSSPGSQITQFYYQQHGRKSTYHARNNAHYILSTGSSTSFASVTITPFIQSFMTAYYLGLRREISGGSNLNITINASIDNGSTSYEVSLGVVSASSAATMETRVRTPNTGLLHYSVAGTNARGSMSLCGAEMII